MSYSQRPWTDKFNRISHVIEQQWLHAGWVWAPLFEPPEEVRYLFHPRLFPYAADTPKPPRKKKTQLRREHANPDVPAARRPGARWWPAWLLKAIALQRDEDQLRALRKNSRLRATLDVEFQLLIESRREDTSGTGR